MTRIFCSHDDAKTLMQTVNTELQKVRKWFYVNKLLLNINKTASVLFSTPNRLPDQFIHNDNFCGTAVPLSNSVNFLGVHTNRHLTCTLERSRPKYF